MRLPAQSESLARPEPQQHQQCRSMSTTPSLLQAVRTAHSGTRINPDCITFERLLNPSPLDWVRAKLRHCLLQLDVQLAALGVCAGRGEGYANSDGIKCRVFSRTLQELDRSGKRVARVDGQPAQLVPSREALHAWTRPEMAGEARPACRLRQLAAGSSLPTSLKLRQQAGQLALLQFGKAGCHTLLEGADFLTRRKE